MPSQNGVKTTTIMLMWGFVFLATGAGAGLGAILFPPGSEYEPGSLIAQVTARARPSCCAVAAAP